jgi:hypothetical protein
MSWFADTVESEILPQKKIHANAVKAKAELV